MKQITLNINFGGFVGAEKEITFEVPDSYSEDDIDRAAQDEFEREVLENSDWEIIDIAEDEDAD